jgi:hypothetical protein
MQILFSSVRAVSSLRRLLGGAAFLVIGGSTAAIAQPSPDEVPLAFAPTDEVNLPSGDRLQSSYETHEGGLPIVSPMAVVNEDSLGFSAAAEIQSRLPRGFVLREGQTTPVLTDLPAPRDAVAAEMAAEAAAPGKVVSIFGLQFEGIPLSKGSDYLAIVSMDGRLLATRERGLPSAVNATEPTVDASEAADVAVRDAQEALDEDGFEVVETLLEIWVDEAQTGLLTWRVVLESDNLEDPHGRQYWISATGEPEIVHWESTIFHTHFGVASGNVWVSTPMRATQNRPLAGLRVQRSGGGAVVTGEDGRFGFTAGSGNATIQAPLAGPGAVIENMAGTLMQSSGSGDASQSIALNFGAAAEAEFAQVSAFYWTNLARRLAGNALAVDPDHAMPVRVNIGDACNAFYRLSDKSINFFSAGGGCPNTAYSDVVLHEYGHYLDHVNGGILDGGWSEGVGDAITVIGTRQPCLGRDFLGDGTCLRRASDVILWPPAPGEGVHARGRRYAGFAWELVQQLRRTYGEDGAFDIARQLVLATLVANPSNIPDAVNLAFLLDDDDGNLANGTPHFRELAAAADSRNLPRPPDPAAASAVNVASAHFPWSRVKKASANANLLETTIRLAQPAEVHITASSSARTLGGPLTFTTGVFNQASPNTMWTNSLRRVTLQNSGGWENFSTDVSITLPAGTHTLFWKVWVSGGEIEFSSGSLMAEGFAGAAAMAIAGHEPAVTMAEAQAVGEETASVEELDERDPGVTVSANP